jgi:hypothetical protein
MVIVYIDHNVVVIYGCVKTENRQQQKCRKIAGNFNHHADVVVQCGTHRLMEHIPGFTRSHWMPPLGECLHRIAPAAAKVIDFGCKHQSLTKHNF